jgi:hypothetical protein
VVAVSSYYAYNASGQRIWKKMPSGTEELYFYGASGQKLGTYKPTSYTSPTSFLILAEDTNLSFGSRTIVSRGVTVVRDRLGSNRVGGVKYYPYGEEEGAGSANDKGVATLERRSRLLGIGVFDPVRCGIASSYRNLRRDGRL